MNINDFLIWWEGFRAGLDPSNITVEHLDIIERKINGLVPLWDIKLPEQKEEEAPTWWHHRPTWPTLIPMTPGRMDIWCGTPQDQPHVGTPLRNIN